MLQTDALAALLQERARPDLATLYHPGMEVQVTVAACGGERIDEVYKGRRRHGWTDGKTVWRPFRIPWKAWSDPRYEPTPLEYDLSIYADGIGLTGWDWRSRVSRWVGFDFDAISGHAAGLEHEELERLRKEVTSIPWVTIRRSTSGTGLHLYVFHDPPIETANHREHAALARADLALMETCCTYPLHAKVDACGQILWVWHRRQTDDGFELIRQGDPLDQEPPGWRQHLDVVSKRRAKVNAPVKDDVTAFEEAAASTRHVPLDDGHRKLLDWFAHHDVTWWWDPDRHMLVCHTYQLAEAYQHLKLRGVFRTASSGTTDQNCFAFPIPDGGWIVRRHSRGTQEASTWVRDPSGWTRCFLNRPPTFEEACVAAGGTETARGGYTFVLASSVTEALASLEVVDYPPPREMLARTATIEPTRPARRHRYVVRLPRQPEDTAPEGWLVSANGRFWERVVRIVEEASPLLMDLDVEVIRHVVAQAKDAGWFARHRLGWSMEPKDNLRSALHALGYSRTEGEHLLGRAVLRPWSLVNQPFGPEYPGNRCWNHRTAQLAVSPAPGDCPTWNLVLDHVGSELTDGVKQDPWCSKNGLRAGGDFLRCWSASLVQEPLEPLPYLAFYGDELTGKSTFHEALGLLFAEGRGYVKADVALRSQGSFNAELASAVLCVVEEVNVAKVKGAYDRLKDWVTSPTLLLHPKGGTPYPVRNSTHWIQCTNPPDHVPIFPGDTRIVLIRVTAPRIMVPKRTLMDRLTREAPAFLRSLLDLELPPAEERLRIPAVTTADKLDQAQAHETDVGFFLAERARELPGYAVELRDLHQGFLAFIDADDRGRWTRQAFTRELPARFPRGRYGGAGRYHVGNLVLTKGAPSDPEVRPRLLRSTSSNRLISET